MSRCRHLNLPFAIFFSHTKKIYQIPLRINQILGEHQGVGRGGPLSSLLLSPRFSYIVTNYSL